MVTNATIVEVPRKGRGEKEEGKGGPPILYHCYSPSSSPSASSNGIPEKQGKEEMKKGREKKKEVYRK